MNSYAFIYTYASQSYKNSYTKYVTLNYNDDNPTIKPTNSYITSWENINLITDSPSCEPTEYFTQAPVQAPSPPIYKIQNNTCICKLERSNEDNILIVVTSITSSLCAISLFLLIWYRFIFKKRLLKWTNNESNFGFGSDSI